MDESELLLTVAEISVAFAGFASIASIFGRRSGHDDARVDSGRLLNMLTTSLTVTGLALLPFVFILMGLRDRWVWGAAGLFGVAAIVSFGPAISRRTARMKKYSGFSAARSYWNYALAGVSIIALIC